MKESSSNCSSSKEFWKKLWDINIRPRAKICVWRVLNDLIPTKSNLIKRGMSVDPICVFCRCKEESSSYVVWQCKFSKPIWLNFLPNLRPLFSVCREEWRPIYWWKGMIDTLLEEERKWAVVIIWEIWSYRNRILSLSLPLLTQFFNVAFSRCPSRWYQNDFFFFLRPNIRLGFIGSNIILDNMGFSSKSIRNERSSPFIFSMCDPRH